MNSSQSSWRVAVASLGLYALLCAESISAQTELTEQPPEQTIEGAQEFLRQILPGSLFNLHAFSDRLIDENNRWSNTTGQRPLIINGNATVLNSDSVERCTSILIADYSNVSIYFNAPTSDRESRSIPLENYLRDPYNVGWPSLHWGSDVKAVAVKGTTVHLTLEGDTATIDLRAESFANRVGYAMEFLRIYCDPTLSTGF